MIKNSWFKFSCKTADYFRRHGANISPSAIINEASYICFPVHISPQVQIKEGVNIDKFTFLNWNAIVYPNVYIGPYCSIGRGVEIGLAEHPTTWLSTHTMQYNNGWFPDLDGYSASKKLKHIHHKKTTIGADVWIGNGSKIKSGITIGHGAIIAAGAVVTKDVQPYTVVGGVPAKYIKKRFDDDIVSRLLKFKWWILPHNEVRNLPFDDIEACLDMLASFPSNR